MIIKDIVTEYLKANQYDGLFLDDECHCQIGDLMPCEELCENCEPGYKQYMDQHFGWTIGPNKKA